MSLEDLYRFGKLKKHKTSPEEIQGFLGVADRCLKDASQKNISLDLRFISAYQGALASAEALLCCFGYEAPRNSYHYMTWEALKNIDDKYIVSIIALFNDARQKRGDAFYDRIDVISEREFNELLDETSRFVDYIKKKIKKEFPDFFKRR
jgi:uncharacterized protein (UPF0332 family)